MLGNLGKAKLTFYIFCPPIQKTFPRHYGWPQTRSLRSALRSKTSKPIENFDKQNLFNEDKVMRK